MLAAEDMDEARLLVRFLPATVMDRTSRRFSSELGLLLVLPSASWLLILACSSMPCWIWERGSVHGALVEWTRTGRLFASLKVRRGVKEMVRTFGWETRKALLMAREFVVDSIAPEDLLRSCPNCVFAVQHFLPCIACALCVMFGEACR